VATREFWRKMSAPCPNAEAHCVNSYRRTEL
jgi:hypothetical protein